jgi:hypothetical protein
MEKRGRVTSENTLIEQVFSKGVMTGEPKVREKVPVIEWLEAVSPYRAGRQIYVRESHSDRKDVDYRYELIEARQYLLYKAGYEGNIHDEFHSYVGWKPASSMPMWAVRIFLTVVSCKVKQTDGVFWEHVTVDPSIRGG